LLDRREDVEVVERLGFLRLHGRARVFQNVLPLHTGDELGHLVLVSGHGSSLVPADKRRITGSGGPVPRIGYRVKLLCEIEYPGGRETATPGIGKVQSVELLEVRAEFLAVLVN
jgi:hypothetical protein